MMQHALRIRMYYEDTDCGGVVYYANYLKYCERARTEFLESKGISMKGLVEEGFFFVVTEASLKYFSPGRYGDIIVVETSVDKIGPASLTCRHEIKRESTGEKLVDAVVRIGSVNQQMKPVRLKKEIIDTVKHEDYKSDKTEI